MHDFRINPLLLNICIQNPLKEVKYGEQLGSNNDTRSLFGKIRKELWSWCKKSANCKWNHQFTLTPFKIKNTEKEKLYVRHRFSKLGSDLCCCDATQQNNIVFEIQTKLIDSYMLWLAFFQHFASVLFAHGTGPWMHESSVGPIDFLSKLPHLPWSLIVSVQLTFL